MAPAREGKRDQSTRISHGVPYFDCPACSAELCARTVPLHSIVLCATCCTPLLWNGTFAIASLEDLAALTAEDRATLERLVAEQRRLLELAWKRSS